MKYVVPLRSVWPSALAAAISAVVASFLWALGFLVGNDWFGVSDLLSFGFLTFPFGILSYLGSGVFVRATRRLPRRLQLALSFVGGVTLGLCFTLAVSNLLGPYFGAFSFPVLLCWMFGGGVGLLVGAGLIRWQAGRDTQQTSEATRRSNIIDTAASHASVLTAVIPFLFFATDLGPFIGRKDVRDLPMTWEIEPAAHAPSRVTLAFRDFPEHRVTIESDRLSQNLRKQNKLLCQATFEVVTNYGSVVAATLKTLNGLDILPAESMSSAVTVYGHQTPQSLWR